MTKSCLISLLYNFSSFFSVQSCSIFQQLSACKLAAEFRFFVHYCLYISSYPLVLGVLSSWSETAYLAFVCSFQKVSAGERKFSCLEICFADFCSETTYKLYSYRLESGA